MTNVNRCWVRLTATVALALTTAGVMTTTTAFSQTRRAAFDVVSVKPNNTGEPRGVLARMIQLQPGGRFLARNVTLRQLVLLAYRDEITAAHLSGGPAWADADHYDVEAVAPAGAVPSSLTGRARARLLEEMVQTLLEERFKLRIRRDTRDADVWGLVVARGGPKLVTAKNQTCAVTEDSATRCHVTEGGVNRGLKGVSIDTHDIAFHLQESTLMERVIDRTGISGLFDVTVTWARAAVNTQANPAGPNAGQVANPDAPDVFTALQEQIGLRLTRERAPVSFVIIESVERPVAN